MKRGLTLTSVSWCFYDWHKIIHRRLYHKKTTEVQSQYSSLLYKVVDYVVIFWHLTKIHETAMLIHWDKQSRIRAHWWGAYNTHSWSPNWCEHQVLQKLAPKSYCGRNSVYSVQNDLTHSPHLVRNINPCHKQTGRTENNCYNDDSILVNGKQLLRPQNFLVFSSNFQAQREGKGDNSDWRFMYV